MKHHWLIWPSRICPAFFFKSHTSFWSPPHLVTTDSQTKYELGEEGKMIVPLCQCEPLWSTAVFVLQDMGSCCSLVPWACAHLSCICPQPPVWARLSMSKTDLSNFFPPRPPPRMQRGNRRPSNIQDRNLPPIHLSPKLKREEMSLAVTATQGKPPQILQKQLLSFSFISEALETLWGNLRALPTSLTVWRGAFC